MQSRTGRPHKMTERDCRALKRVVQQNSLSSIATHITESQNASGSSASSVTVHRELKKIGFHGQAAVILWPNISMINAKRQLDRCKAQRHWTLEQWKRVS